MSNLASMGHQEHNDMDRSEMNQPAINMIRLRTITLIGSVFALAGCNAGGPINVVSYYRPGVKFSGLGTTYTRTPNMPDHALGAANFHELIQNSVNKHLASHGFNLNSSGAVDFWVNYRLARNEKTYAGAVAHGQTIDVGSLVLEVFDPTTRKLIWRGIADTRILSSDSPEVRKNRLENAMRALMAKFPAK